MFYHTHSNGTQYIDCQIQICSFHNICTMDAKVVKSDLGGTTNRSALGMNMKKVHFRRQPVHLLIVVHIGFCQLVTILLRGRGNI